MQLRVVAASFAEVPCRTRTPFRFGRVTLEAAPLLHAAVRVEAVDGREATGMAADLLVPQWFRKDPDSTAEQDQRELHASALSAARTVLAAGPGHRTVFAIWRELYGERVLSQSADAADLLVRGFGTALIERAVIDAACRLLKTTFWSALQRDLFGVRLGDVHEELAGQELAGFLPDRPAMSIQLRHTVGMLDPLRDRDAPAAADGEPRSVEGYLRRDRLRWLKVKVGQGHDDDLRRLCELARLCREVDADVRVTLDGNEQFASLDAVADLLDATAADPDGRELVRRLAHIEQPLPRQLTFDAAANRGLQRLQQRAPLVLDEADTGPGAFPRALLLGWRGCSVKNCKGVFRALANHALARQRGLGAFVCAEDLTNLPLLALQQDLATVQALGIEHVERNGHHYFPGLAHLPDEVRAAALRAHPDLYRPRAATRGAADAGDVVLRIDDGALQCASLLGPGYGCDEEPFAALRAALSWQPVD